MDDAREAGIRFHNQALAVVPTDLQLAYRLLCSAVTVDGGLASSLYMLGNACADLSMRDGGSSMMWSSVAAFRRMLNLEFGDVPGDLDAELHSKGVVNLGHRLLNVGLIKECKEFCDRVLSSPIQADFTDLDRAFAYMNLSMALSIEGDLLESLHAARSAFELVSDDPMIETSLAFALLHAGEYAEGLRHFEARFAYKKEMNMFLSYPYVRWDGGPLDGTLFVASDMGMGDTLSMARFVPLAAKKVKRLLLSVQPELVRLLADGFRFLGNVVVEPQSTVFPIGDAWCPVMSLPVAMGLGTEEIRDGVQGWKVGPTTLPLDHGWKAEGARLHVGIAFAGSALNAIDRHRSIEAWRFLEMYRVPGVQLYSLQVGERVGDLHAFGMAGLVRDLSPWIRDAADTVSIVRELDLVVTVESFVGHLCGALGKRCWVLVSYHGGDWRVGRSGDRPLWYGKTRIFRQGSDGDWGPVFGKVVRALGEHLA